MEQIIIKGKSARYMSDISELKDGLPKGVVNKVKTDAGGTFLAANDKHNYVIACPFKDLVDSIYLDKNNKYPILRVYGGTKKKDYKEYIENNKIHKIVCTYDSFEKVTAWLDDPEQYRVLIDEFHLLLDNMDFREDAITKLIENLSNYEYYTFLSATPIDINYNIPFLNELPHYKIDWDGYIKIKPYRIRTSNVIRSVADMINIFLNEGFKLPTINNTIEEVKELYIFLNSVSAIRDIITTLDIDPRIVKICCADNKGNRQILDEYSISSINDPNRKINFFTSKCYQGCNLFTNSGLIIVASDSGRSQTLVDVSTSLEQICGRLRTNGEYNNIFKNILVHIYSTRTSIESDEEFNAIIKKKEEDAKILVSEQDRLSEEGRKIYFDRIKNAIKTDVVSLYGNRLKYNPLKKQSFVYKHNLRKAYKDGYSIRAAYEKSEKFEPTKQLYWKKFTVKMKSICTISYQTLIEDYYETKDGSLLLKHPEFADYVKYLTIKEIHTLRYKKSALLDAVDAKKYIPKVIHELLTNYKGTYTVSELKAVLSRLYKENNISQKPKTSILKNIAEIEAKQQRLDGKSVRAYIIK